VKKIVIVLIVTAMLWSSFGAAFASPMVVPTQFPSEERINQFRIFGEDRYDTAYQIAKQRNEKQDTVILVRGDGPSNAPNIIDGITASSLVKTLKAHILLTEENQLPEKTMVALENLSPEKIVMVGGTSAISAEVEETLKDLHYEVDRIAGEDRAHTAAKVALEMETAKDQTAIIVDGEAELDALVAGPLAFQGHPILIVNNQENEIPETTQEALKSLGIERLILIGGSEVISEDLEVALNEVENIESVSRFGGKNRIETSLLFAEHEGFGEEIAISLVSGESYVDATAASTLGVPIVYYDHEAGLSDAHTALINRKGNFQIIGGSFSAARKIMDQRLMAQ